MTDRRSWKVLGRLIRWNARRTMSHCYFFPTLVQPQQPARRKTFNPVFEEDDSARSPALPHLSGVIKLRHKGEQRSFWLSSESGGFYQLPVTEEEHILWLTRQQENVRPPSLRPGGRGLMPGWRRFLLPGRRWWQGGRGYLLNLFFSFFFLSFSPPGMLFNICPAPLSLYCETKGLCTLSPKFSHAFFHIRNPKNS